MEGMEVKLAEKAISGDEDAFLSLLYLHKKALYRTALAYLKNEEEALEAVQEVTYRAFEKIQTVRKPEYIKTWLVRIMINYCNDTLKLRKRIVTDDEAHLQTGISEDYTYLEVEEALAQLTEEERDLVHLKYIHDIKIKDIAEMSSTPEGTVKTRLYKALRQLRSFMEGKGESRHVR